jgi:hypothetical protein
MAVDEVIMKQKGRMAFRQYIPKTIKKFRVNLYKLCDSTGYTCIQHIIYLRNQRTNAAENVTPTHGTILKQLRKAKDVGQKLFMDAYFHHLNSLRIYTTGK